MKPVIVKTFDNYFSASIFQTRLEDAGVPCNLVGETMVTTIPFLSNMLGGIKLLVNEGDAERAKELILRFEKEQDKKLTCPQCGSENFVEMTKPEGPSSESILYRLADDYPLETTSGFRCFDCDYEYNFDDNTGAQVRHKKAIAVIPARYASTRFPFKLMQPLGGKSVIRQTHDNVVATSLFDEVLVVTDHASIFEEINSHGGRAVMSRKEHESGSDRIAEAVATIDVEVIINVQGDEPFVNADALRRLIAVFEDQDVKVASLMKKFTNPQLVSDPNYVKVVTDKNGNALYFSRSIIPHDRDASASGNYFEHIGVYAYRKEALLKFTTWPVGKLEAVEKLEQLRYLENGIAIRMVETETASVKIDVPADLAAAQAYWEKIAGNEKLI